jgi:hypothetical protein
MYAFACVQKGERVIPPNVREVPLTRGHVALVDAVDYERVVEHRWYARIDRHTVYGIGRDPGPPPISQHLHRFILGLRPGDQPVDHIDGNGLHCWRTNLRVVTASQNAMNRIRQRRVRSSHWKGVGWHDTMRSWRARIKVEGKQVTLGFFDNERDAAEAYDAAARALFGAFACVNFPRQGERPALAG